MYIKTNNSLVCLKTNWRVIHKLYKPLIRYKEIYNQKDLLTYNISNLATDWELVCPNSKLKR